MTPRDWTCGVHLKRSFLVFGRRAAERGLRQLRWSGRRSQRSRSCRPPAPKTVTYAGGDGHDCAHRVIVQGASGELDGVSAEYDWLAQKSPGYKRKFQSLTKCDGKPADKVTVETASGDTVDVYFDISEFFGKGL